ARAVQYRETGSAFEQALTYYRHAKQIFPKRYRDLMRLRPAAVLKVNLRNAYPRCYVTRRIAVDEQGLPAAGAYYGPFAARPHLSGMPVFRDENVPGAVFCGLHKGRVRRGGEPVGGVPGDERGLAAR